MNFFEQQDRARASSRRLYALYGLALLAVVGSINVVAVLIFAAGNGKARTIDDYAIMAVIVCITTLAVMTIILVATLLKQWQIGGDGANVAEMLGGRPMTGTPGDLDERKLINVVEEMSIASGVPMPRIFLLDHEEGINAFAAGKGTDSAVLGVTRGSIRNLTRDELQGVIGHEFSHILNGDMRLNLRLISLNFGLMALGYLGLQTLRFMPTGSRSSSNSNSKDGAGAGILVAILILAIAMAVLGYIGTFFGKLLQAAVSRQREYLADASAVQFTRNPKGIGNALRKIAGLPDGSTLGTKNAGEVSHMFFAGGVGSALDRLFATHPPIDKRILAIDPTLLTGPMPAPPSESTSSAFSSDATADVANFAGSSMPPPLPSATGQDGRRAVQPTELLDRQRGTEVAQVYAASRLLRSLPRSLVEAARDPYEARAVALALLMNRDDEVRKQQFTAINAVDESMAPLVFTSMTPIDTIDDGARLPLLDLTMPALRQLSPSQLADFRKLCQTLAEADQQLSPFEIALLSIIENQLGTQSRSTGRGATTIDHAARAVGVVLSVLSNAGGLLQADSAFAAGTARLGLSQPPPRSSGYDAGSFLAALAVLRDASSQVQRTVVDAAAHCVVADGTVRVAELELMRATCAALNVPIPPLLQAA